MSQNDYQMALLLQQQFEQEAKIDSSTHGLIYERKKSKHNRNDSRSLTDPSWELVDPTPDIHLLFIAFNERYFWSKLLAVCVDWSKRMTTCAGICSYQGRGGLCRITLSEPLLKLRPRKDLVETLLHEMIHAYLFVTHNNKDRDGHGPEFHKHMHRINSEAGTNITVYHDFHDEVRLYKQHWWRCDGPCQHRKPYFGMVRRATNRAPGPNDFWWNEHRRSCGGTFIKVKEPEKPVKGKEKPSNPNNDIRKFIPVVKVKNPASSAVLINGSSDPSKHKIIGFKDLNAAKTKNALSNSSSTIVINKKPSTSAKQPKSPEKSHLVQTKLTAINTFSGKGQVLSQSQPKDTSNYEVVRNHWINKFPSVIKRSSSSSSSSVSPKRIRSSLDCDIVDLDKVQCPVCDKSLLEAELNLHLDECLLNQASSKDAASKCPVCDKEIETSRLNEHVQMCIDAVFDDSTPAHDDFKPPPDELIPCLVCNKNVVKSELYSHLDDCMGDNIFNNSSTDCVIEEEEEEADNIKNEEQEKKYNCPVCFQEFSVDEMTNHLDQCLLNDSFSSDGEGVVESLLEDYF